MIGMGGTGGGPFYWGPSGAAPITDGSALTRPMIVHGGRTMGWP